MRYLFYFLLGGTITTVVTYLASHSRGLLAAFVSNLPISSLCTFLLIYFTTGQDAVVSYAKGLTTMLFPWLFYISCVIFLTPRISFLSSLLLGVSLFILIAGYIVLRNGAA
ncbi:MAG: hypothetical protein U0411_02040 [Thermodesulfovibrionales bacterium]